MVARHPRADRRACTRDPQFGPCVMLGIGGVLAEAIARRRVPARAARARRRRRDARRPRTARRCSAPFRGEPAVDRAALARRAAVGCRGLRRGATRRRVGRREPADRRRRRPAGRGRRARRARDDAVSRARAVAALFEPRGVRRRRRVEPPGQVRLRRAAQHPARRATRARSSRTNREGGEVLGIPMATSVDDLPDGATVDLVFVCTPAAANPELLRGVRARGASRAAFVTSGGLRRGGRRRAAAPSTSSSRSPTSSASCSRGRTGRASSRRRRRSCAQIVAPYPPPGPIGDREPVRQLRLVVPELRGRRPASA